MYGIELTFPERVLTEDTYIQDVASVREVRKDARQIMPTCSPSEWPQCRETEKGFSSQKALAESARCLQCGLICYEHTARQEEKPQQEVA